MTNARYVLGLDTSSRHGSIALAGDGAALQWEPLPPGGHSSGLSQSAERLLAARGIGWKDLAGVAVSEGPGSFTGLRIGLSWAKGICLGSGLRLVLVSAHEAAAAMHRREGELIATVLQGERGEAHAALWSGGAVPTRIWGPEAVPEEDLVAALRAAKPARAGDVAIGITAPDLRPPLREALRRAGFPLLDADGGSPVAIAVAERGDARLLAGESADLASSAPAYGRSPNARKPAS
ncbi:MAG TPA: tRNA (adenosine(37)-N6)-threonylcarbamoyltransferase complex dimerization subunit type 1 TsaB [Candidatus Saccharimonadales bacterium]|nr:tRNA (adenosine(37)-N6)-threonylcarbamoyltransferase complex dimerization subunit type 1 TsaB [Candidatus Saccharimonadales bacterium]